MGGGISRGVWVKGGETGVNIFDRSLKHGVAGDSSGGGLGILRVYVGGWCLWCNLLQGVGLSFG